MTVSAPTNLSYGKVVWQTIQDIVDGSDPDLIPDFIAPTGKVSFVASIVAGRDITAVPNAVTVAQSVITGILDSDGYLCTPDPANPLLPGARGVWLIATDDPDLNPTDWAYNVVYEVHGNNNILIPFTKHQIYVPTYSAPGDEVDLTVVGPVDNAQAIGIPAAEAAAAAASVAAAQAAADAAAAAASALAAEGALVDSDAFIASKVATSSATQTALNGRYTTTGQVRSKAATNGTNQAAVLQAEINALLAAGGGTLLLPSGTITTTAALTVGSNITIQGQGSGSSFISNGATDIFLWSGTQSSIRDVGLLSTTGGGHVFKQSANTTRCHFENLYIDQQNDAKSVYSHIADAGNYLFNAWKHVTPYHRLTATVPTFHFVALTSNSAINANSWEDMDPTRSGNYVFHFESARSANYVYDNALRDIRYERPDGGCVRLLGTNGIKITNNTVYDLVTPTRDMFYIGRGTHVSSPVSNRGLELNVLFAGPVTGVLPIKFQTIDGGILPALETHLRGIRSGTGPVTVDFGSNSGFLTTDCEIARVNGDRVFRVANTGIDLPSGGSVTGKGGTRGVAVDAGGGAQVYGPLDSGMAAQQLYNCEFDSDIREWVGAGLISYASPGKMRINNTSGTFANVTGNAISLFGGSTVYKVVLKLATVTAFPVPTTSLRLYDGAGYTVVAGNTTEQIFYQTLGTGGLVLRTGDGLDVELDYLRVFPITGANLNAHGDIVSPVLGKGIRIKEGANGRMGVATLVAGTVVVSNTTVTALSRIQLTAQSLGTVTSPKPLAVSARAAGASFTILSGDLTDTSVVAWEIKEPA